MPGLGPNVGPRPAAPASVSSEVEPVPESREEEPRSEPREDEEDIAELGDSDDLEEVDAGELLTASASSQASALPIGGEDGVAPLPPAVPDEPPRASILDEAVAEAMASDFAARAADLANELAHETDRRRIALIAYELGELTERRLRDEAGAVKSYGRALQSDPSLRPNLWAIRRVFYRRGLWPNLLKLIDADVRFARSDAERADLLVEKAQVIEDRQGDVAGAREVYDKAIALDPTSRPALLGRERLALVERDNEALLRVWRYLADATEIPARKVGYLIDAARLVAALALAGPPADRDAALEEAQDIISEATALAASPGVDAGLIARERERLAEIGGDAETMIAAIEARIALVGTDPARSREVVALRRRQAQVLRDLGDRDRALRALELAGALAPSDPLILYDLVELAEGSGDAAILATALERLVAVEGNVPPARELYLALRRVEALTTAGRPDEAEALRRAVAERAPDYLPFIERAQREALRGGDVAALAALRLEEARAAQAGTAFGPGVETQPDLDWAAGALTAAGDLFAHDLGQPADARAAYEQALVVVAGYPPAVEALLALCTGAGDLDAAVALLERELPGASGDRAAEMLEQLAGLYQDLGRTPSATATLERLATLRPDDAVLRYRLEHLYAAAGQHRERLPLLEALAETADGPRRAALYFEIGRVCEQHLEDAPGAVEAYRRALAVDPQDRTVRGALLALLRQSGRWDDLAAELRNTADLAEGPGAVRSLREAAAIFERRLGRPSEAATIYRELTDRVPDDAAALRGLARTLAATHAESEDGRADELAAALEREAAVAGTGGGPAAGQAQVRLGDLYERLGRTEDATAAYARAEGQGGVGLHAHWALAELASRRGDRGALAAAFAGLADRAAEGSAGVRADLLEELAWLSDDIDRAAELFADIAARAPERHGALLGKALVSARKKDAGELAAAVVAQAEQTGDKRVAAALFLRAATLVEVESGRGGGGQSAALVARALALDPDDPGALVAAVERPAAEGDGQDRDRILARRAELVDDPEARALDDLERAERAAAAGRLAEAGRALASILAAQPDHLPALLLLRRVAGAAGDNDTVARTALRLGRTLGDPALAARALADAATLLDGPLGRHDEAGAIWRGVFDLDPLHPVAFRRAHDLLVSAGDTGGIYELLTRKIESLGPSVDVIGHRLERAGVARKRKDDDAAAADLEAILELDPNHLEALSMLAHVRLAHGDSAAAATLLRQYNESVTDPELRADAELRLAEVLHRQGHDDGAIEALDVVLTVRPEELRARERLVELLFATGDNSRGAEELERLAARRKDFAARARDELRAGRLFRDQLHDTARARQALERARAADPLALEVLRELADLVVGPERPPLLADAASAIRGRMDGSPPPLRALAQVARLGDDGALAHAALGALAVLGVASDEERQALGAERQRAAARPLRARRPLTEEEWSTRVQHPDLHGVLAEAWGALAESAARAGEVEPTLLGFTRGDRVSARAVTRQAPVVDTAQKLLAVGEIDLYVTAGRTTFARSIGLETPIVLLSTDVARGESLEARALLGRTLAAARLKSGPVEDFQPADLAVLLAAGLRVAGIDPLRSPVLAERLGGQAHRLDERVKLLGRTLGRKEKKILASLDGRLGGADLGVFIAAVRATHRRAALLLAGDLPTALGRADSAEPPNALARDVAAWGVAEATLSLRKDLGL